jgi:hypothetical protein
MEAFGAIDYCFRPRLHNKLGSAALSVIKNEAPLFDFYTTHAASPRGVSYKGFAINSVRTRSRTNKTVISRQFFHANERLHFPVQEECCF